MSALPGETIACPACGKRFAWKAALAGRQVRCKCGNVFSAVAPDRSGDSLTTPASTPTAPSGAGIDAFDLYPASEAPPAHAAVARAARNAPVAGPADDSADPDAPAPALPSALTAYATRRRRPVAQEADGGVPSAWKDVYLPIGLGLLGLAAWAVMGAAFPLPNVSPGRALFVGAVAMLANMAVLLLSLFAAASLLGLNFGPPRTAAVKLLGMSLFAGAAFFACVRADDARDVRAIVGLLVVVLLYWTFFATLFDLEMQETLITVAIVGLVQAMAGCVMVGT